MQTIPSFRKCVFYLILFFLSLPAQVQLTNDRGYVSDIAPNSKDSILQPVRVPPVNPKCFLFRDEPMVFLTATEHYGAVMNRPFRYERYLADERELTDKAKGQPIHGHIKFDIHEGFYEMRTYSPETGLYSPGISIQ